MVSLLLEFHLGVFWIHLISPLAVVWYQSLKSSSKRKGDTGFLTQTAHNSPVKIYQPDPTSTQRHFPFCSSIIFAYLSLSLYSVVWVFPEFNAKWKACLKACLCVNRKSKSERVEELWLWWKPSWELSVSSLYQLKSKTCLIYSNWSIQALVNKENRLQISISLEQTAGVTLILVLLFTSHTWKFNVPVVLHNNSSSCAQTFGRLIFAFVPNGHEKLNTFIWEDSIGCF